MRAGETDAKAIEALKVAVRDIAQEAEGDLKGSTSLKVLAASFLQTKIDAEKTDRTIDTYRHQINKIIVPRIGDLSIAESTTGRLQKFFTLVNKAHGHGSAKGCRSVLSGMFALAVRNDVLTTNPVVGIEGIKRVGTRAAKAIPLDEVAAFRKTIREDDELNRLDIVDLFDFMLFTGCRIGEALALRWSRVDEKKSTVTFNATVNRVRGQGLLLQEHVKGGDDSSRTISVAPAVFAMLGARDRISEMVFPSMLGNLRDTTNTEADWRVNRDRLGYPGMTSHAFRKTVATALDVAGLSARAIAEYLGHKQPSMTQDKYMSRNTGSAAAAKKLEAMFGVSTE